MKVSLFVALLFILSVNSRNVDEKFKTDDPSDSREDWLEEFRRSKNHGPNEIRHRRKRWQYGYGYNYPPPPPSYYEYDRRDDRNVQNLLPQILTALDEIKSLLKRPPLPPPQPIYIPYPVSYSAPRYKCRCPSVSQSNSTTKFPSVDKRWPIMDDTNQNWGFVESEVSDNGVDDARPISFDPITPIEIMKRPQPPVEHGSSLAGSDLTTQDPFSAEGVLRLSPPRKPGRCDAAVLSCCGLSSSALQQRKCFNNFGCDTYYSRGNSCDSENVSRVLDSFKKAYSLSD